MKLYNKLVRDRIPEIIQATGKSADYEILSEKGYAAKLEEKLMEETKEYLEAKNTGELADLLEVIRALAQLHDCSMEELEALRQKKAEERGAFKERLLLKQVWDRDENPDPTT